MIPVSVESLLVGSTSDKSVVILKPYLDNGPNPRVLPIYIGMPEAISISMALEGRRRSRPQTHDLTLAIIEELGANLLRVVIDRVDGMTFYAKIVMEQDGDVIEMDARPSDAIAIAMKAGVQIYVESPVFIAASIPYNSQNGSIDDGELEAFKEYVDNLSPDDFKWPDKE